MKDLAKLLASVVAALAAIAPASAAGASTFDVVAVGDIACAPGQPATASRCRQAQVADLVGRLAPKQLWLPGDLQYPRGEPDNFRDSFGASFGRFKRISRPVPGNHEYYTPGAAGYYGYFGRRAGRSDRGYYSFDAGAWHVVALNGNCDYVSCAAGSPQLRWLARDLRSNPNRCVAALLHFPRFSSGEHGESPAMTPFWRALRRARAEFVVSGHDHNFEAFHPQDENGVLRPRTGVTQYVVGTGGYSLYDVPRPMSNSQEVIRGSFGVLKLGLRSRSWVWSFISETGARLGGGRGSCR